MHVVLFDVILILITIILIIFFLIFDIAHKIGNLDNKVNSENHLKLNSSKESTEKHLKDGVKMTKQNTENISDSALPKAQSIYHFIHGATTKDLPKHPLNLPQTITTEGHNTSESSNTVTNLTVADKIDDKNKSSSGLIGTRGNNNDDLQKEKYAAMTVSQPTENVLHLNGVITKVRQPTENSKPRNLQKMRQKLKETPRGRSITEPEINLHNPKEIKDEPRSESDQVDPNLTSKDKEDALISDSRSLQTTDKHVEAEGYPYFIPVLVKNNDCTGVGYNRHPKDCAVFYRCTLHSKIEYRCEANMAYHTKIKACLPRSMVEGCS